MKLELSRLEQIGETVVGELRVDGQWHCWTLEDRVRAAKNHPATAIPAGVYDIRLTRSGRLREVAPEVVGHPEFAGVRLHGGNPYCDMSGSILLGVSRDGTQSPDSRKAYNTLMYRFENVPKGGSVSIVIKQPVDWPTWGERVYVDAPRRSESLEVPRWNLDDLQPVVQRVDVEPLSPGAVSVSHPIDSFAATVDSDRAWRLVIITWILAIGTGGYAWMGGDYKLLYLCAFIALFITALWFIRSTMIGRPG